MTIHTGDCIEVMRTMPADSVDAVVTDPPYGLEFMGKGWDKFGAAVFHDPSKLGGFQDGNGGNAYSRKAMLTFQAWCQQWGTEALRVTRPGGYLLAFGGTRTHHRLVCGLEDAGWIIRDELTWVYASGFPKGRANLKPAHEPIVLARKPGPLRPLGIDAGRIPTEQELRREVGGWQTEYVGGESRPINTFDLHPEGIPGRWPSNVLLGSPALFDEPNPEVVGSGATTTDGVAVRRNLPDDGARQQIDIKARTQRDDDVTYGGAGGYSRFFLVPKSSRADREPVVRGQLDAQDDDVDGSFGLDAARPHTRPDYQYQRKARENAHPTVKPVDLMRHLIRLVTPSGGTVLDCFAGSGSTLLAAELEGFPWIGIEQDASYVAIAEARLNGTQRGMGLDVSAPTRKRTESTGQATGYDWGESQADAVVPYSGKKLRSGVHYGDGLRRPEQVPKPVADSAPMWSIEEPA